MSRADAILASAVQIAGPLTRVQDRIIAVKMHPDAVSVLQLHSALDEWKLERLVSWSLEAPVGRAPVRDNFPYLVDQIGAAATEASVDGVDAGISIPFFPMTIATSNSKSNCSKCIGRTVIGPGPNTA